MWPYCYRMALRHQHSFRMQHRLQTWPSAVTWTMNIITDTVYSRTVDPDMAPYDNTAYRYQRIFRLHHRPWTSTWVFEVT